VESVGTIPSRKLFSDALPTVDSNTTPSRIFKKEVRKIALTPIAIGKNGCFDNKNMHPAFAKESQHFKSPEKLNVPNSLNQRQASFQHKLAVLSYEEPSNTV
jgi:hypothetical protein